MLAFPGPPEPLPLLGYTHDGEANAARMEALETRVLAGLGIRYPYVSH